MDSFPLRGDECPVAAMATDDTASLLPSDVISFSLNMSSLARRWKSGVLVVIVDEDEVKFDGKNVRDKLLMHLT